MIKYSLRCSNNHAFDGWFANSAGFDEQQLQDLIACPACGTTNVEKALMAPSVTGTKMQKAEKENESPAAMPFDDEPMPTVIPEPLVHGDATMKAVISKMRELRSWVENNAENVGEKFAEKARKMHYGKEKHHGIFGRATFDEAQGLMDDGIDFMPLPALPEDNN